MIHNNINFNINYTQWKYPNIYKQFPHLKSNEVTILYYHERVVNNQILANVFFISSKRPPRENTSPNDIFEWRLNRYSFFLSILKLPTSYIDKFFANLLLTDNSIEHLQNKVHQLTTQVKNQKESIFNLINISYLLLTIINEYILTNTSLKNELEPLNEYFNNNSLKQDSSLRTFSNSNNYKSSLDIINNQNKSIQEYNLILVNKNTIIFKNKEYNFLEPVKEDIINKSKSLLAKDKEREIRVIKNYIKKKGMVTISQYLKYHKDILKKKPLSKPIVIEDFYLIEKCYKGFIVLSPKSRGRGHELIILDIGLFNKIIKK